MRCESCGNALTPTADPLCPACLAQLRAGEYSRRGEDPKQRFDWGLFPEREAEDQKNDESSAA